MPISAEHLRLRWVQVDGTIIHVDTLRHLPPRERPVAHCPVCERVVTLKLGRVKVPHYAHRPEDECAASGGESALHLNTKFHLFHILKRGGALRVLQPCAGSDPDWDPFWCSKTGSSEWQRDWDEVGVEKGLGSRRPDLTLYRGGTAIAAIEVFASHSVDEAKRVDLEGMGIPWIEVRADPVIFEGEGWTGTTPLAVYARHPEPEPWRCREHAAEFDQVLRARQSRTLFLRIVDYYYPSGGHYRDVFRINAYMPDGVKAEAVWVDSLATDKFREVDHRPERGRTLQHLESRVTAWLEAKRRRGIIVDSPMDWVKPSHLSADDLLRFAAYPGRYRWAPSRSEWFLLRSMLDLRWDRSSAAPPAERVPSWWPNRTLDLDEITYPHR